MECSLPRLLFQSRGNWIGRNQQYRDTEAHLFFFNKIPHVVTEFYFPRSYQGHKYILHPYLEMAGRCYPREINQLFVKLEPKNLITPGMVNVFSLQDGWLPGSYSCGGEPCGGLCCPYCSKKEFFIRPLKVEFGR